MNRGQLWANWRKSFLTVVNALIMCMGATIVSALFVSSLPCNAMADACTCISRWCADCIRREWRLENSLEAVRLVAMIIRSSE